MRPIATSRLEDGRRVPARHQDWLALTTLRPIASGVEHFRICVVLLRPKGENCTFRFPVGIGEYMIVGGNIDHVTRTMTTAIALETSKGNLSLAIALGAILLAIAIAINMALISVKRFAP